MAGLTAPPAARTGEDALGLATTHAGTPSLHRAPSLRRHLSRLRASLERARTEVARAPDGAALLRAAEWLHDNAWLIGRALQQVRYDLPRAFYRELPRVRTAAGVETRIGSVCRRLVRDSAGHVDVDHVASFLDDYQERLPLTMGELWAVPAMLRLALLELLVDAAAHAAAGPGDTVATSAAIHPLTPAEIIATCVPGLSALAYHDWNAFFERVSRVHRALTEDPAGLYERMDFETRDRYRKAVERMARRVGCPEERVARTALGAALASGHDPRRSHVGFHLVDEGRCALLDALPCPGRAWRRLCRRLAPAAPAAYIGTILVLAVALDGLMLLPLAGRTGPAGRLAVAALLLVPAVSVAVALVNAILTRLLPPRALPKLEFTDAIPGAHRTMVAVPVLLSTEDEVRSHLQQLRTNQQGNRDGSLTFALLADFPDAPGAEMPGDAELLETARAGIRDLNTRAARSGHAAFLLLHRPRRWNPAQGCWMGWERKRGKLAELNDRLLGTETELEVIEGDATLLDGVRYVITLDADTFLPPGAARRLAGTLAHPLNRPAFDAAGRVTAGYTVIQPRVETTPATARASLFARIYEGEQGLDLYSHAVSDVYQDAFGEGVYAGKGIYDVAAFRRSLEGRVPENALLSHDLFEGVHGRAGLATDIAVFEDYPAHVLAWMRRRHRWVRGDWQIAPWLFPRVPTPAGPGRNPLSLLDRWKIADNLRRSLLAPALLVLIAAAWTLLPEPHTWWMAIGLLLPGLPIVLAAGTRARLRPRAPARRPRYGRRPGLPPGLLRWLLLLAFLPFQAWTETDAIVRALYRLTVSRRKLLMWTSAAHVAHTLRDALSPTALAGRMAPALGIAAAMWLACVLIRPDDLFIATPLVVVWLLAPWIAARTSRVHEFHSQDLPDEARARLRVLGRRTWGFYERLVGPNDHWLPPDHMQVGPPTVVAHRTSPTNIGLQLAAVVSAWDLGYVSVRRLAGLLDNTFDTLDGLDRIHGHFLNWYDTRELQPLPPRYVSTVDSGNLAAALLVAAAACDEAPDRPLFERGSAEGLRDALAVLRSILQRTTVDSGESAASPGQCLDELDHAIASVADRPGACARFIALELDRWTGRLESDLTTFVEQAGPGLDDATLRDLRFWIERVRNHAELAREGVEQLLPWVPLPPEVIEGLGGVQGTGENGPHSPDAPISLREVPAICTRLLDRIHEPAVVESLRPAADADLAGLAGRLRGAAGEAERVLLELTTIALRARAFVAAMDFRFLYDENRHLFHIGYDADAGRLDSSYYDLLASEARLASHVAIAEGQVPVEHWLHLGRPFGRAHGRGVLLSWGGTLFEYLLPTLFQRTSPGSMLDTACRTAIQEQIRFAEKQRVPWGMSESGYAVTDAQGTYQYRAFGTPTLGLRRDPADRVVVAPYASLLALRYRAGDVVRNLAEMEALGLCGEFGVFEALDFGPLRRRAQRPSVVRSWMAHHQGMILVSVANLLTRDATVERFHSGTAIASTDFLLGEQSPGRVRADPLPALSPLVPPRAAPAPVSGWAVDLRAGLQAQVLSNGSLTAILRSDGGGQLRWNGVDLTRYTSDLSLCPNGTRVRLRDLDSGSMWSATGESVAEDTGSETLFAPHSVEYHRRRHGISTRLSITVALSADVEVRRLTIVNESPEPRSLAVTSSGEVALAGHAADRRHPAFQRLFVDARFSASLGGLVFRRRRAADDDPELVLAHALYAPAAAVTLTGWETDRARFLGRARAPSAPAAPTGAAAGLDGRDPATIDPLFSLSCEVRIEPEASVELAFLTAAGRSQSQIRAAIDFYRSPGRIAWAFDQARVHAEAGLHELGISAGDARALQRLVSALVLRRAPRAGIRAAFTVRPIQQCLWSLGVSGDLPIVLAHASGADSVPAVRELVRAWAWLRHQGFRFDLVLLDKLAGGYAEPLRESLLSVLSELGIPPRLAEPGGIFHVADSRLDEEVRAALTAAAAATLDAREAAPLASLVDAEPRVPLPAFVPVPSAPLSYEPVPEHSVDEALTFDNGLGGFSRDGSEYVIRVRPGVSVTPAPWINVVANPGFGFTVSESGAGCTWWRDSGELRLTPWTNDPVLDTTGEALYGRDEETGDIWSLTPEPAGAPTLYEARHRAGASEFLHRSHGLAQRVRVLAALEEPVKLIEVELRDLWNRQRRITLTHYVEWVLGGHREVTAPFLSTWPEPERCAILARQGFGPLLDVVGFTASSASLHGATGDRTEFLHGVHGPERPAALDRIGLAGRFEDVPDPCAVLQVHLDIAPAATTRVWFLLGAAHDLDEARERIDRFRRPDAAAAEAARVVEAWDERLGRVRIRTPDPAMDLMVNRWLPCQALACRLWGRTGLYQSSGAFGFRDQLQDSLAFLLEEPSLARDQIREAARRQFLDGDVLHWWRPGTNHGVRTRCSDDLVWLPWATSEYVEATGDTGVLDEPAPWLVGAPLAETERDRYAHFATSEEPSPVYEHCLRALQRACTRGAHGLPLIGSGDWNDALDSVGDEGRGESVWLALFLAVTLDRFAKIVEARGDTGRAATLRGSARRYREAVEREAWDGEWYRRAWRDDGEPVGSAASREARIDSLTQSWAVLAGADRERACRALAAVREHLIRADDRLVLLLDPPFRFTRPSPGYIQAYPAGVRENGGQYTHAAVWVGFAFSHLGQGDAAWEIFRLLNPIHHAETPRAAARYRTEPYVVAADVYSHPAFTGRGGWTWYTGSAAWLRRLALEAILGIRRLGSELAIEPCIPREWPGFGATVRFGGSRYDIDVRVEARVEEGVSVSLDGRPLDRPRVPLADDGAAHSVVVRLGRT